MDVYWGMDNQKGVKVERSVAWQAKQLYEQRDAKGKRIYGQAKIAKMLGVSETTVWRAVNDLGRFGKEPLPEVKPQDQLQREAEESLQRAMNMEGPLGEALRAAQKVHEEQKKGSIAQRMAADAAQKRAQINAGDELLKELTDGKQGREQQS